MTIFSYHSTHIDDLVSHEEAVDTTSSQIVLSRDIAGADNESVPINPSLPDERTSVVTIFENNSMHVMTLGQPARSSVVKSTASSSDKKNVSQAKEVEHCLRIFAPSPTTITGSGVPDMPANPSPPLHTVQQNDPALASSQPRSTPSPVTWNESSTEEPFNSNRKGKEVDRGRSIDRIPRQLNPLSRAHSRGRLDDISIELDTKSIQKCPSRSETLHQDPATPTAVLDDNLLEPCPEVPVRSFTEVLDKDMEIAGKGNTPDQSGSDGKKIDNISHETETNRYHLAGPSRSLTTAFDDLRPIQPAPTFSSEALREYLPGLSHTEYLALKSSSSKWSKNVSADKEPAQPTLASQLPAEIIHEVYRNLGPFDFNSARHTCRVWYIHSLDRVLLETMLKRGGWSNNLRNDLLANHIITTGVRANDEWLMSKMIARECALGPDWTGNGLFTRSFNNESVRSAPIDSIHDQSTASPFFQAAIADFGEVGARYSSGGSISGMVFTVSVCGKYLMVANGCLIYIYQLNTDGRKSVSVNSSSGSLRPVTSIICPRRVLACSMDTSSQRHAIAVLLDGRMGLVCDLSNMNADSSPQISLATSSFCHADPSTSVARPSNIHHGITINSPATHANGRFSQPPFIFSTIDAHDTTQGTTLQEHLWSGLESHVIADHTQSGESSRQAGSQGLSRRNTSSSKSMPLESGPRSIYRNLCSADDPPRSVAICPQRRCVAFGCSAGIELHWIDALTGQDLNRWFPLTAPSDYLYFLPPRRGVDSAKKLRLISSAARPGEAPALADRFRSGSGTRKWLDPLPSAPMEQVNWDTGLAVFGRTNRGVGSRGDTTDHYRAVPLSDGYHILFTDPATSLLCLGSDAPIGGPTKLLRKIWFIGPKGCGSPIAYTGGADLRNVVRVVAAYGPPHEQRIFLFSVPIDVFTDTQAEQTMSIINKDLDLDLEERSAAVPGGEWVHWWKDEGLQNWLKHAKGPYPDTMLNQGLWPVEICGQEIGKSSYVVDLAVDSGSDLSIWAFGRAGISQVWKVDTGRDDKMVKRVILRDGTVMREDSDGELEISDMVESPDSLDLLTPPRATPTMFDGNRSSQDLSSVRMDRWSVKYDSIQYDAVHYDADGDVLMADLQGPPVLIEGTSEDGSEEAVAYARDDRGLVFESSRWSGRYVQRHGHRDTVEELTGIARIDIEIR